jgi:vacuolar-type H+-ATPase subunit C/Vma6
MSNGLYTRDEIACMTRDALDELQGYYADKGNAEGVQRVQDELDSRYYDELAELEHEQEEARKQQLHDEMIDDALTRDGRWG